MKKTTLEEQIRSRSVGATGNDEVANALFAMAQGILEDGARAIAERFGMPYRYAFVGLSIQAQEMSNEIVVWEEEPDDLH